MKNSYPLRGGYYTNWDGGVRANAFVNGGAQQNARYCSAHFSRLCISDGESVRVSETVAYTC
eukprot:COSAG06_NODE_456_length_15511_cov_7.299312_11_plen_62_part_00